MAEQRFPGVFIEETDTQAKPIEGVPPCRWGDSLMVPAL